MELKEFIAETLKELISGVKDAQEFAKDNGALINPNMKIRGTTNMTTPFFYREERNGTVSYAQIIDFDIAITSVTNDTERGGIGIVQVFDVGVHSENQDTRSEVSRVKFSVPVMFPMQESTLQRADNTVEIGNHPLSDFRG